MSFSPKWLGIFQDELARDDVPQTTKPEVDDQNQGMRVVGQDLSTGSEPFLEHISTARRGYEVDVLHIVLEVAAHLQL